MSSFWKFAIALSLLLHAVLLSALGAWYFAFYGAEQRALADAAAAQAVADLATPKVSIDAPGRTKFDSPDVTREQVAATLEKAQDQLAGISTEEQLGQLEKHAARLESFSSEQAVGEIADKFREWQPTPARASEPAAAPVAGDFDFDSAQIHDVLRAQAADGGWEYRSVLVDAEGRTFEVEIDRVQGEKTYATFASLKKFPLANQVYRTIAMSLIDQALQAKGSAAAPAAVPAATAPATTADDDRDPFDNSDSE